MGSLNHKFSEGLSRVLRRFPSLPPNRTRELAVEFVQAQRKVCETLAALNYPLERYVLEITSGSLSVFREGADTDRKKGNGKGKAAKKASYRFAGLTAAHVEEFGSKVAGFRASKIGVEEFQAWQSDFLMRFTFDVIEEVAGRSLPPPAQSVGMPSMKQLRWKLADMLAAAREIRKTILEGNLLLVAKVCQRFFIENIDKDDMFAHGVDGLTTAVNRYDPAEAKFSTCAVPWILQDVKRFIAKNRHPFRVPIGQQERAIRQVRTGEKPDAISELLPKTTSFDAPVSADDEAGFTLKEVLPDPLAVRPSVSADRSDLNSILNQKLQELDPIAQLVLALRVDMGNAAEIGANVFRQEVALSRNRRQRTASEASKGGDEPARLRQIEMPSSR